MKNKEIEELLNKIKQQFIIDEKFAKDFHKTTLNYEETKLLLSYIEQLEKKVDKYENPEDLTLFYMWLDTRAKDKIKQLENNRDKALRLLLAFGGGQIIISDVIDILKGDSDV